MRRSQASARESPAPAAAPRTIAMVGFAISCSRREISMFERRECAIASSEPSPRGRSSTIALTSPPEQKARPAPVSTTAPTLRSPAMRESACSMRSIITGETAFRRSGRFIVSSATPSEIDSSSSSAMARASFAAAAGRVARDARPFHAGRATVRGPVAEASPPPGRAKRARYRSWEGEVGMTELAPSALQARIRDEMAALLAAECPPARVRAAEPLGFDPALWKVVCATAACAEGTDLVSLALAAEECGRALAPVPFAEWLAVSRLLRLADPRAGAPAGLVTLALRAPSAGLARLVPAGAIADAVVALDGDALVLAPSAPPLSGPRTLPDLPLADRRLDGPGRVVLAEGADAAALHDQARAEWQVLTAAALVGLAERALAMGVAHVKERVQFGVAIGSFQTIQHRLADRATELAGGRLLGWRAACATDRGAPDRLAWAAAAFLFASQVARATTDAALHYHGGRGYTLEHDIQLFHRRAGGWPLVLGDAAAEWQRLGALLYGERGEPVAARPLAPAAPDCEGGIEFQLGERSEAFRADVRAFLAEHLTPEVRERTRRTGTIHEWGFHRALAAAGFVGAAWPVDAGGRGRDPWEMLVFAEECARADAPTDGLATTMMVAGTLRAVASEALNREVLPRVLRGEIAICLGYSEPEAGSDLANVQTRAVRDGGDWILRGEKTFTSLAHEASYVFLLARTSPDAPKRRGLTMFLVPMDAPGVSVEPVYTLGAPGRTNRTSYRDVRVPDACRVGEVDGGWSVVNVALTLERSGMFGAVRSLEETRRYAVASGRIAEPALRARLARVWTENEVAALLGQRVAWLAASGGEPGIESAMSKLFATESTQRSTADLLDLLGAEGLLCEGEAGAPAAGAVEHEWRKACVGTIYAGTSEVMRSIIAERHLGLPRTRAQPARSDRVRSPSARCALRFSVGFACASSCDAEEAGEVVAHDREHLLLREGAELGGDVLGGEGQALGVREVGSEDDRLDPDLLHDALHVLLREGRDDEVLAEDLARATIELAEARPAAEKVGGVELAQQVGQPHRALLGQAHAHVREAAEEPVHDQARNGVHRRPIAPEERPLQPVEVAEHGVRILAQVGAVLLVVGRPDVRGDAHARLVDPRPEGVEDGIRERAASARVVATPVRVARDDLDESRPLGDQPLELPHREVDVGEREVGRQEHPTLVTVADLLVDPAVVGLRVGVDRLHVVGELVLEVQHVAREHDRGVDPLLVHQREAQVPVAPGRLLLLEARHQRLALLGAEVAVGVQAVQEHAGRAGAAVARLGLALVRGPRSRGGGEPLELLRRLRRGFAGEGELRGAAPVELDAPPAVVAHEANGLLAVPGLDVPLVHVLRLDEVVVGVVDPEGELLAHARPSASPAIGSPAPAASSAEEDEGHDDEEGEQDAAGPRHVAEEARRSEER